MSFYTHVKLFPLDAGTFDLPTLAPRIDALVADAQLPEDVASDIKQLLDEEEVGFSLDSHSIIDLMGKVAALAPSMTFALRGTAVPSQPQQSTFSGSARTTALGNCSTEKRTLCSAIALCVSSLPRKAGELEPYSVLPERRHNPRV
jgi:hypothetical protein